MPHRDDIDPYSTAFFFDFDGTLADIAERPDLVALDSGTHADLATLVQATDGAVAVVSGRPIDQLTAFLDPLECCLAGVHGLETRDADGTISRQPFDADLLHRLLHSAEEFALARDGVIAEAKPGSLALHYRLRPDLEGECLEFAKTLAASGQGIDLIRGKMVFEIRLGGRSKADAVSHFMAQTPFAGRTPVFVGDDVTDEDGFRRAAELGGSGYKIGEGETAAAIRFDDTSAFRAWLGRVALRSREAGTTMPSAAEGSAQKAADARTLRSTT